MHLSPLKQWSNRKPESPIHSLTLELIRLFMRQTNGCEENVFLLKIGESLGYRKLEHLQDQC